MSFDEAGGWDESGLSHTDRKCLRDLRREGISEDEVRAIITRFRKRMAAESQPLAAYKVPNKFSKVGQPPTPDDLARGAAIRAAYLLQRELFYRLCEALGASKGGCTSWMMVRLAQPAHADHTDAVEVALRLPAAELEHLTTVASDAAEHMTTCASSALADAVVSSLVGVAVVRDVSWGEQ